MGGGVSWLLRDSKLYPRADGQVGKTARIGGVETKKRKSGSCGNLTFAMSCPTQGDLSSREVPLLEEKMN